MTPMYVFGVKRLYGLLSDI